MFNKVHLWNDLQDRDIAFLSDNDLVRASKLKTYLHALTY